MYSRIEAIFLFFINFYFYTLDMYTNNMEPHIFQWIRLYKTVEIVIIVIWWLRGYHKGNMMIKGQWLWTL